MKLDSLGYAAIDRDGTLIVERHRPLTDSGEVELIPGAVEGLKKLIDLRLRLIIITNQSGIGRGSMTWDDLEQVNGYLIGSLAEQGVFVSGIYVCHHAPWELCNCRKPLTGLLKEAAMDLGAIPSQFVVIGDKTSDIDCGRLFGASTILVRTGYGAGVEKDGYKGADYIADDLLDAAGFIEILLRDN